jgi:membrane-bound lytic murein transglycosylase MltF
MRKKTKAEGLDPNQWFGNVELIVAKEVGQETVQYVSNIYKYYVAYKLTEEQSGFHDNTRPRAPEANQPR